jgi:biotin-(acetyl-CoA carboxylase) ligase
MWILTDCREYLAEFVPEGTAWSRQHASALSDTESVLWRSFTDTSTVHAAQITIGGWLEFWCRLIVIGEARRSQFDALQEVLDDGLLLDGPTAVLAMGGRGFHGQRGRPWLALPGNLFLTAGLPIRAPTARLGRGLVMLPAVAAVDAIRACAGASPMPSIKWVNDVLIDGHKVGGVLAGSVCRGDSLEVAVLGVGVNVAHTPSIQRTPFVPAANCLNEAGSDTTLAQFTWCLLEKLAERHDALLNDGPAGLLRAYRQASCVVGRRVRVWDESVDDLAALHAKPAPLAAGVVESIGADLSLRMEEQRAPLARGRLAFEEDCAAFGL